MGIQHQRLRVNPIMDELLLYGKKAARDLKEKTICVGTSAGGI